MNLIAWCIVFILAVILAIYVFGNLLIKDDEPDTAHRFTDDYHKVQAAYRNNGQLDPQYIDIVISDSGSNENRAKGGDTR